MVLVWSVDTHGPEGVEVAKGYLGVPGVVWAIRGCENV